MAIVVVSLILLVAIALVVAIWSSFRRRARRLGYESLGEYLRTALRSDEEKRDASISCSKGS